MTENQITEKIIGAANSVHGHYGPGLLEEVYESPLAIELRKTGLNVKQQVTMPVFYKGIKIDEGFKVDLLVEDKVIVEVKSLKAVEPLHFSQAKNYLKMSNLKVALLINFNTKLLKDQIHRVVHNFY